MIKSENAFTLIELMVVVVIIGILAAIALPNFIRMQKRAKEADVKSVAHTLQLSLADYRLVPSWLGQKPAQPLELQNVLLSYMPNNVQVKQNPFNPAQNYGPPLTGIQFGPPAGAVGVVYYDYTGQTMPYTLTAYGGDQGLRILVLSEES